MSSSGAPADVQRAIDLHNAGRLAEAENAYQQLLAATPNEPNVLHLLGIVLVQQERPDEGIALIERAIAIYPAPEYLTNLAQVFYTLDRFDEAAGALRRATQIDPGSGELWFHLGNALFRAHRAPEAVDALRRSLQIAPNASAENTLGLALLAAHDIDGALAAYTRAIALDATLATIYENLGSALRSVARIAEATDCFRKAASLGAGPAAMNNVLFTMHYDPAVDASPLGEAHRRWGQQVIQGIAPLAPAPDRTDRRLRIGFVSGDFNSHPAARFLLPLLQQLDGSRFEIALYYNGAVHDDRTLQFQYLVSHWREIRNLDDAQAASQILSDRIDVLFDLSLHSQGNRLGVFAHKPAPIQATWLGYASTTGLPTIDFRLSDWQLDPNVAEDRHYAEQTIRLAGCFWCFQPFPVMPPVAQTPSVKTCHITFGSLNNFAKVNAAVQTLWAQILAQIPKSRMIIHSPRGSHRSDLLKRFADAGVVASRVDFVEFLPTQDYLAHYGKIDIALDPFPFTGGTTTCDALWMGVPVVTLAGPLPVSRGGASILHHAGLPELIAQSQEQYIQLAINLARDANRLTQYRATLREQVRTSPLTDASRFARDFESAIRQMWLGHPR